ncbi:MAG TPA: nuclear transport factor 2 family protein [Gemmatimonadaceae bacterium]
MRILATTWLLALAASAAGCVHTAATPRVTSFADSASIALLERRIEQAQVVKDMAFLDSATDSTLRFTHGGGTLVQTRAEWLRLIASSRTTERDVSDQHVEVHGDLAVTTGRVRVRRPVPNSPLADYTIGYVRVYRCTDRCRLVSHVTTESTLPPSPPKPRD